MSRARQRPCATSSIFLLEDAIYLRDCLVSRLNRNMGIGAHSIPKAKGLL